MTDVFTVVDEPGCTGIETCMLYLATGGVCGTDPAPMDVWFDMAVKALVANKAVIEGYSHELCLDCYIHTGLSVSTVFTISQSPGCTSYLTPIPAVTKTMAFQGDPMLD